MSIGPFHGGDVRAVLRLVGEASELLRAGESATAHVLIGLRSLTHSQIAMEAEIAYADAEWELAPRVLALSDQGWESNRDRAIVYDWFAATPLAANPFAVTALRRLQPLVTLVRSDTMSSADWERSILHNQVHRPAGIDDCMLSLRRLVLPGAGHLVVMARAVGERPFDARERDLVHFLLSECPWVFERPRAVPAPDAGLSRRERDTFALLLTDASEKQIAARLGLSRYTVHGYIKTIYKKLGVTSRAELMARALAR
jgi:DNA-binding CsgD family transcriptional regulator